MVVLIQFFFLPLSLSVPFFSTTSFRTRKTGNMIRTLFLFSYFFLRCFHLIYEHSLIVECLVKGSLFIIIKDYLFRSNLIRASKYRFSVSKRVLYMNALIKLFFKLHKTLFALTVQCNPFNKSIGSHNNFSKKYLTLFVVVLFK